MASLGILSGSPFRNSLLWLYASPLSLIAHLFLFYYQGSPFMYTLLHLFISLFFLLSYLFVASLGILSGSPLNPSIPSPSLLLLFLSLPLPPSLPCAFVWPQCFPKVFAQSGFAQWGSTCGRSCPTLRPLTIPGYHWCRLWCAAVHERSYCVPPILPVQTMFIEAADHQLYYSMCLGIIISNTSYLSLSSHSRSLVEPIQCSYTIFTPLYSLISVHSQWNRLSGIGLRHIVRPILSFHPLLRLYSMLLP